MISVMHLSGDTYASLLSVVNDIQNLKVTSSIKSLNYIFVFWFTLCFDCPKPSFIKWFE